MKVEEYLRNDKSRAEVYRLLSRCFYPPDEQTSARMEALNDTIGVVYPEVAILNADLTAESDIERLQVDFAQLFVGPFKLLAPPYGSIYLEPGRRVMGDSTMDAKRKYHEAGLDFSDSVKEAPDHIALELEFMYYLKHKASEALTGVDWDSVLTLLDMQRRFLAEHLAAWVPAFAAKVEKHAATDYCRELARITSAFVQEDQTDLAKLHLDNAFAGQPTG